MSAVFSAFTLAYSLFEVPSGWLGDVIGPAPGADAHRVVVVGASRCSPARRRATIARSPSAFCSAPARPGAFPNAVRSFSHWFPVRERGRANGVLFFGSRLGGALTAPLALAAHSGAGAGAPASSSSAASASCGRWRGTRSYRDRPAEHPAVDAAELAWIKQDRSTPLGKRTTPAHAGRTPWARSAREPESLRDLRDVLRVRLRPLLLLHLAADLSDPRAAASRRSPAASSRRCRFCSPASPTSPAAGAPIGSPAPHGLRHARVHARVRVVLACAAAAARARPSCRAPRGQGRAAGAGTRLGGLRAERVLGGVPRRRRRHAGVVTGFMNTIGNLGGLIGPLVVGVMVERWGSWTYPFYVTAAVYVDGRGGLAGDRSTQADCVAACGSEDPPLRTPPARCRHRHGAWGRGDHGG